MPIKEKIYNLLRWSEKYIKTDMTYLVKGSFWLTFRQLIFSISAFLVAVAFARLLPKETYGQYKYILSIVGILAISSLNRIDTAIILAIARKFEKVAKEALRTKLKWSLLGSFGAIALSTYFWIGNNPTFAISFLIVAFFLPLMESSQIYLAYLSGKKLFDIHAKYNSIVRVIASIGLIAAIFFTKNIAFIILSYFLFYTILRTYFLYRTFKKFPPNQKTDPQFIPYGKQLSFLGIINSTANYLDKILVYKFLGAAQLAIYAFATIPVEQINTILQSIRLIAMPKFSAGKETEIKKALPNKIIKATFIIVALVAVYIFLAPYFYQIFFPQYIESVNYSRFFAISLILFPMTFIGTYFAARIKKREVYTISLIPPLARIIFLFILAPLYGIIGVISAILLTGLVNAIISVFFLKQTA